MDTIQSNAVVRLYTKANCPYCVRAKALLQTKSVAIEEIRIDTDPEARLAMEKESGGRRTVPQIFIGSHHVGGCDDLMALQASGELDTLLTVQGVREHGH